MNFALHVLGVPLLLWSAIVLVSQLYVVEVRLLAFSPLLDSNLSRTCRISRTSLFKHDLLYSSHTWLLL